MLTSYLFASAAIITAALASPFESDAQCGETDAKVCFGINGGTSQDLRVDDVKYVADYLRYISDSNQGDAKFWKMPKAVDCAEWSLPIDYNGSVLALAKHINPRTASAVLYEDLAAAIDGGLKSKDGGKNELLGCGKNGGMIGVKPNLNNPLYHTKEYQASGASPDGILIKLVKAPPK